MSYARPLIKIIDNNMHKIFGVKQTVEYVDREGAYLIPYQDGKVGVVKTPKGFFFLGGGIKVDETHQQCIERECLEESGYSCCVLYKLCSAETYTKHPAIGYFHPIQTYYLGNILKKIATPTEDDHQFCWVDFNLLKGTMFVRMQNWALEQLSIILKETK